MLQVNSHHGPVSTSSFVNSLEHHHLKERVEQHRNDTLERFEDVELQCKTLKNSQESMQRLLITLRGDLEAHRDKSSDSFAHITSLVGHHSTMTEKLVALERSHRNIAIDLNKQHVQQQQQQQQQAQQAQAQAAQAQAAAAQQQHHQTNLHFQHKTTAEQVAHAHAAAQAAVNQQQHVLLDAAVSEKKNNTVCSYDNVILSVRELLTNFRHEIEENRRENESRFATIDTQLKHVTGQLKQMQQQQLPTLSTTVSDIEKNVEKLRHETQTGSLEMKLSAEHTQQQHEQQVSDIKIAHKTLQQQVERATSNLDHLQQQQQHHVTDVQKVATVQQGHTQQLTEITLQQQHLQQEQQQHQQHATQQHTAHQQQVQQMQVDVREAQTMVTALSATTERLSAAMENAEQRGNNCESATAVAQTVDAHNALKLWVTSVVDASQTRLETQLTSEISKTEQRLTREQQQQHQHHMHQLAEERSVQERCSDERQQRVDTAVQDMSQRLSRIVSAVEANSECIAEQRQLYEKLDTQRVTEQTVEHLCGSHVSHVRSSLSELVEKRMQHVEQKHQEYQIDIARKMDLQAQHTQKLCVDTAEDHSLKTLVRLREEAIEPLKAQIQRVEVELQTEVEKVRGDAQRDHQATAEKMQSLGTKQEQQEQQHSTLAKAMHAALKEMSVTASGGGGGSVGSSFDASSLFVSDMHNNDTPQHHHDHNHRSTTAHSHTNNNTSTTNISNGGSSSSSVNVLSELRMAQKMQSAKLESLSADVSSLTGELQAERGRVDQQHITFVSEQKERFASLQRDVTLLQTEQRNQEEYVATALDGERAAREYTTNQLKGEFERLKLYTQITAVSP